MNSPLAMFSRMEKKEPMYLIEIFRCNGCRKEFGLVQLTAIAEMWHEDGKDYGRYIYACKDCYEKELITFKENMHKDAKLIIREKPGREE